MVQSLVREKILQQQTRQPGTIHSGDAPAKCDWHFAYGALPQ